jgi:hypothetical protein
MRIRNTILLIAVTVLLGAMPGKATDRLKIDVSPRISAAPAVVRIRATVTPSAENRGLRIVADSGDYFRSSFVPLDGADAASVTVTSFKNLPGGEYDITVTLVGENGDQVIVRRPIMVTALNH